MRRLSCGASAQHGRAEGASGARVVPLAVDEEHVLKQTSYLQCEFLCINIHRVALKVRAIRYDMFWGV